MSPRLSHWQEIMGANCSSPRPQQRALGCPQHHLSPQHWGGRAWAPSARDHLGQLLHPHGRENGDHSRMEMHGRWRRGAGSRPALGRHVLKQHSSVVLPPCLTPGPPLTRGVTCQLLAACPSSPPRCRCVVRVPGLYSCYWFWQQIAPAQREIRTRVSWLPSSRKGYVSPWRHRARDCSAPASNLRQMLSQSFNFLKNVPGSP